MSTQWGKASGAWGRLKRNLEELARVPARAAGQASRDIADMVQEGFDLGSDPYGKAWKELRPATLAKGRHPPPLTDTRDMRDTLVIAPMAGAGIKVEVNVPYGSFHQSGTKNMAARPFLPTGPELPIPWSDAIERAFRGGTRAVMRGR